jgi:DNA-3-methyladenine glycosylase II
MVRPASPLDLAASLEPFGRWGDDLMDRWDGRRLLRTVRVDGRRVGVSCTSAGTVEVPALRVVAEPPSDQAAVAAALLRTFVRAPREFADLCRKDPVVGELDRRFPGVRPVLIPDLLSALVRCISAQQINLRFAATLRGRLAEGFGDPFHVDGATVHALEAARIAAASVAEVRALQFTTRKAQAIIAVADAVGSGTLDLSDLRERPDEDAIHVLTRLPGIGRWSAEWVLARTLGRARVVAGDLGVRKAVGSAYLRSSIASEDAVRRATAHWGAAAGVAQQLLLHGLNAPGVHG